MSKVRPGDGCDFVVTLACRGRAAWASRGPTPIRLSYHVLRVTDAGTEVDLVHEAVCWFHERGSRTAVSRVVVS